MLKKIKNISLFFLKIFLLILAFILAFFVFLIFFLISFFSHKELQLKNRIYPKVYINSINFGGKTITEVENHFQLKNEKLKKAIIVLKYKDRETATFSGEIINLKYDEKTLANHAALIGRSPNLASKLYQRTKTLFNLGRFVFSADLEYNKQPIEDYLNYLEEKYSKPAENALFKLENNKVTAFRQEKYGIMIKNEKATEDFKESITKIQSTINYCSNCINEINMLISIEDEITKPEITLSSVNNFGIVEKIGEGRSDYTGSIPGRIHNIILASSKLNGILIPKDEIFSFNKVIGDISQATGYKPAYIIKEGRTVLGDGGGVCQVSTTLFRTVLNTGLPIIERVAHAYRVHYYENDSKPGFDATVFALSADLKFKNDTSAFILIQTAVDKNNNKLTYSFYGKKDNRQVEISDIKLWDNQPPPSSYYQDDPTLKKGVKRQVDWSAWGAKASFRYKVEKDGAIIIDKTFFSSFRPWRAVYLVGTMD